jgi:aspartate aminotransferase
VTSNVNAVAQQAALAALQRRDLVAPMVEIFHRRRDLVTEHIARTPGLSAMEPEGTFYSFMDVGELLGDSGYAADVDALCARLLDEHKVVVVPGTAFGNDHHARLSFAASDDDLDRAFERLQAAFS